MGSVDLNIVLLGKTGAGKSASGNTILGEKAFVSKLSFKSVTSEIKSATANIFGKQITVFDTPGILNHEQKDIKTLCENLLQSSIPCLFLVAVKIDRFTEEEQRAVETVMEILGPAGLEKSYILFTKGDSLKGMPVVDFIFEDKEGSLPVLVSDSFGGRYYVFNNEDGGQDQVEELLKRSSHITTNIPRDCTSPQDRRIILLGLPGVGKSASANTILGSDKFDISYGFNTASKKCESKLAEVAGRTITVVDTPGISIENSKGTMSRSAQELYMKTMMSVMECPAGPHAFVIVVRLGSLSSAEIALLKVIPQLFGKDALKYALILFTHGEELGNQSLDENIKANKNVSKFVEECGGRYLCFDNKRRGDKNQVKKFLNIVDEMVEANGGHHFDSPIFKVASTAKKEETNAWWERVLEWLESRGVTIHFNSDSIDITIHG